MNNRVLRLEQTVSGLRRDVNEQRDDRKHEIMEVNKEIKNSVMKAKTELTALFETMLHENTVEVEENQDNTADVNSDLLSSQLAQLDVFSGPISPILRQSGNSVKSDATNNK